MKCAWCGKEIEGYPETAVEYTHTDKSVEHAHKDSECEIEYDNSRGLK